MLRRPSLRQLVSAGEKIVGAPVDIASLAAFRILFGLVMCAALVRSLAKGWVTLFFIAPSYHFTYQAFPFVHPWPGAGMYVHFALTALAALGVATGFYFRLSAVGFFLGFAYIELIDKAMYLNHYYLVTLLSGLLAVSPAGRAFSLDSLREPSIRTQTVPGWMLHAFRYQVGLVYVFAGIAKLNHDWLLEAEPLRMWLAARSDLPLIGPLLELPATAQLASWAGALFDLTIVPWLLWPKSRAPAFACVVLFHVATALLFPIGMFPWIMIAAATLFFSPSWPRRSLIPSSIAEARPPRWVRHVVVAHCLVQTAIPLRGLGHTLGNAWTLRGFNFAWNVMIAEKSGDVVFTARDRTSGETEEVAASEFLAPFQERAMAQDPEMIRAFAADLARRSRERGRDLAVYAHAFASLNGRPTRLMIDPSVDLAAPAPESFILPLE